MKAIETIYKGYRFRSRLEARWAVFFDTLGIPFEYEKEGYDLGNGVYYLPDFWLPTLGYWIEIKGEAPTKKEIHKLDQITGKEYGKAFIFSGEIGPWDHRVLSNGDAVVTGTNIRGKDENGWDGDWQILECPTCGLVNVCQWWDATRWFKCSCNVSWTADMYSTTKQGKTTRLTKAYDAARQARFEHGENGTPLVKSWATQKTNKEAQAKLKELRDFESFMQYIPKKITDFKRFTVRVLEHLQDKIVEYVKIDVFDIFEINDSPYPGRSSIILARSELGIIVAYHSEITPLPKIKDLENYLIAKEAIYRLDSCFTGGYTKEAETKGIV